VLRKDAVRYSSKNQQQAGLRRYRWRGLRSSGEVRKIWNWHPQLGSNYKPDQGTTRFHHQQRNRHNKIWQSFWSEGLLKESLFSPITSPLNLNPASALI
jgi:hypothetical protein